MLPPIRTTTGPAFCVGSGSAGSPSPACVVSRRTRGSLTAPRPDTLVRRDLACRSALVIHTDGAQCPLRQEDARRSEGLKFRFRSQNVRGITAKLPLNGTSVRERSLWHPVFPERYSSVGQTISPHPDIPKRKAWGGMRAQRQRVPETSSRQNFRLRRVERIFSG